jgi:hypothetical protein
MFKAALAYAVFFFGNNVPDVPWCYGEQENLVLTFGIWKTSLQTSLLLLRGFEFSSFHEKKRCNFSQWREKSEPGFM